MNYQLYSQTVVIREEKPKDGTWRMLAIAKTLGSIFLLSSLLKDIQGAQHPSVSPDVVHMHFPPLFYEGLKNLRNVKPFLAENPVVNTVLGELHKSIKDFTKQKEEDMKDIFWILHYIYDVEVAYRKAKDWLLKKDAIKRLEKETKEKVIETLIASLMMSRFVSSYGYMLVLAKARDVKYEICLRKPRDHVIESLESDFRSEVERFTKFYNVKVVKDMLLGPKGLESIHANDKVMSKMLGVIIEDVIRCFDALSGSLQKGKATGCIARSKDDIKVPKKYTMHLLEEESKVKDGMVTIESRKTLYDLIVKTRGTEGSRKTKRRKKSTRVGASKESKEAKTLYRSTRKRKSRECLDCQQKKNEGWYLGKKLHS